MISVMVAIHIFKNNGDGTFATSNFYYTGLSPYAVSINDIDNDGDMDVITFTNNGTGVEYHQNQSQELGFNCDSLIFKVKSNTINR